MNALVRHGSGRLCEFAFMLKRMTSVGAVAVALAASTLLAAPASADPYRTGAYYADGYRDYRHNVNEWGQPRKMERRMKRRAARACRAAIRDEAYRIGFRDVDFDEGRRVRQIGPRGFRVYFPEVEFEGRRREIERGVSCIVRRGHVRRLHGIPEPGRRHQRRYRHYDD